MAGSKVLRLLVALDSLYMAYGHAPFALIIGGFFRPGGPGSPFSMPPGGFGFFFMIGAYFLFATVIYFLGAIFVASGNLLKLSNVSLIILAVIDNILLVYTRQVPDNILFNRIIPWSSHWIHGVGTVQVLLGQTVLVILCAILLYQSRRK